MPACLTAVVDESGVLDPSSSDATVAWWSFTKTLLAACVLLLSERRLITLDDRLEGLPFTPRQLLQHRAGVGDYGGLADYHAAVERGDAPWSEKELLRRISPHELVFDPGAGWAYSNVGYLLLRREVERRADTSFADAMARLVLRPLGLQVARIAESAEQMQGIAHPPRHTYDPAWVYHGCVVGPVCEAALALHRLLASDLLAPASREALLRKHPIGGSLPGRPWIRTGYGLGVMMGLMGSDLQVPMEVVGHSAGGPGSVGAVYSRRAGSVAGHRSAACFTAGDDAGAAEFAVLRMLQAGDSEPERGGDR
jgi:CubicO group peptidase (beta-lactamase class C family)